MPDDLTKETRPDIKEIKSSRELKRWYWLKEELGSHARDLGIKSSGAKFDILERIGHFLDTSERSVPLKSETKPKSKFDWHSEPLNFNTIITDNYKNTQNVRNFFKKHAFPDFKFNIAFMEWMKGNTGKTLQDAIDQLHAQRAEINKPGYQTDIKPHNQFNQYTRDFLNDNPELGMNEVRKYWSLKRALPSKDGRHTYERSDLALNEKSGEQ